MIGPFDDFRVLKKMNWLLNIAVGLLIILGIMFIYSACYIDGDQAAEGGIKHRKQMLWAMVGLVAYLTAALYDYRWLGRISWVFYAACLVLLVSVLIGGETIGGARRWLKLPGGVLLQPSELAKLAVIIVLSRELSRLGSGLRRLRLVFLMLLVTAIPMALILVQDLGTTIVFVPIVFAILFVGGARIRVLLLLGGAVCILVMLVLGALFLPAKLGVDEEGQARVTKATFLKDYQRQRIEAFFDPEKYAREAGYSYIQTRIAVGSGGVFGKGFTKGTQNILGFLPRSVAPTDFLFSVIAEETGFVGSVVLLLLFGTVISCGMHVAALAREKMGRLLCVGVVAMFFSHAFINVAMIVGLLPITGLPLPLLSYGGSFMVCTMGALGLIQSVYIRSHRPH